MKYFCLHQYYGYNIQPICSRKIRVFLLLREQLLVSNVFVFWCGYCFLYLNLRFYVIGDCDMKKIAQKRLAEFHSRILIGRKQDKLTVLIFHLTSAPNYCELMLGAQVNQEDRSSWVVKDCPGNHHRPPKKK